MGRPIPLRGCAARRNLHVRRCTGAPEWCGPRTKSSGHCSQKKPTRPSSATQAQEKRYRPIPAGTHELHRQKGVAHLRARGGEEKTLCPSGRLHRHRQDHRRRPHPRTHARTRKKTLGPSTRRATGETRSEAAAVLLPPPVAAAAGSVSTNSLPFGEIAIREPAVARFFRTDAIVLDSPPFRQP